MRLRGAIGAAQVLEAGDGARLVAGLAPLVRRKGKVEFTDAEALPVVGVAPAGRGAPLKRQDGLQR